MNGSNPEFLAERLIWQFRRSGGDGEHAGVFDSLAEDVREYLYARASVRATEIPVLANFRDKDTWVILTTERLLSCEKGIVTTLETSKIDDTTVELSAKYGARDKAALQKLVVYSNGKAYSIVFEAGRPLIGLWNVLKALAATNRKNE